MRDGRRDLQQTLDKHRLELAALEARIPISAAAMSELEAAVKVGQEKVDDSQRTVLRRYERFAY
jgi:hypothetical protein